MRYPPERTKVHACRSPFRKEAVSTKVGAHCNHWVPDPTRGDGAFDYVRLPDFRSISRESLSSSERTGVSF